jgi:hypothetical protein
VLRKTDKIFLEAEGFEPATPRNNFQAFSCHAIHARVAEKWVLRFSRPIVPSVPMYYIAIPLSQSQARRA